MAILFGCNLWRMTTESKEAIFSIKELLQAVANEEVGMFLTSNGHHQKFGKYDYLAAGGAVALEVDGDFKSLRALVQENGGFVIAALGYDLKNSLEKLHSENPDFQCAPQSVFFEPAWVVYSCDGQQKIWQHPTALDRPLPIQSQQKKTEPIEEQKAITLKPQISKEAYLEAVEQLKKHIQLGDIYEVTFCQQFFAENATIAPIPTFERLNQLACAPFAALFKFKEHWVLSASPERYLAKRGDLLVSQPIKGTAPRSPNEAEDLRLKTHLAADKKERAENVMIVDLVRNDLSRVAAKGSVVIPGLFEVHTFNTVHQMIGEVQARLHPDFDAVAALEASFPMGSMTGAPKVRAMELIEKTEAFKRGMFSGGLGYFDAEGDFDFNVVIRSIIYNADKKCLSVPVGSAITILSDPEQEYQECLVKLDAMRKILSSN